jgi:hypothetical protein
MYFHLLVSKEVLTSLGVHTTDILQVEHALLANQQVLTAYVAHAQIEKGLDRSF